MPDLPEPQNPQLQPTKRDETIAFLFLAFVLFPLLSVILIGGFGFVLWMSHLIWGPPGSH